MAEIKVYCERCGLLIYRASGNCLSMGLPTTCRYCKPLTYEERLNELTKLHEAEHAEL